MKFRSKNAVYILGFFLYTCIDMIFAQEEQSTLLEILVPHIDQEHFKLDSSGQHYTLNIELPDGSTRSENVELRDPNTPEQALHVMGEIKNNYEEGSSEITYEAGKNGVIVKYKYRNSKYPIHQPFYISLTGLKSAAG